MVRRTKEEAQETRAQIIEAAERAFYKRGVARTTLADIAELAGVTRGRSTGTSTTRPSWCRRCSTACTRPMTICARERKRG